MIAQYYKKPKSISIKTCCMCKKDLMLFPQERDWTCSIACLRSILSGFYEDIPTEQYILNSLQLTPGPYFSKDIKKQQIIQKITALCGPKKEQSPILIQYGCDNPIRNISDEDAFEQIAIWLKKEHAIILESAYNEMHWMVLLGYVPKKQNGTIADCDYILYDPYQNTTRILNAEEFITMWNCRQRAINHDVVTLNNG